MSRLEKAKERLRSLPSDYTFSEARALLTLLGFEEFTKGKTSGSRVKFYRETDQKIIMLHKPHPGDVMKKGAVKYLKESLQESGDI